jgi:tRNA1(Val) A37 N6-methylase TrmN6
MRGVSILPLWPRDGVPAKRVIVQALKGSGAAQALLPGLVLHDTDGRYTAAADAILRDGAALTMETRA